MQESLSAQITADIHRLESLPTIVIEALDKLSQPDVNLRQVSEVIGQDAVITARMMSIANSVYYRRGAAVHRLSDALVRLGIAMVKEVLLTASVIGIMDRQLSGYQLDRGQIFRHSLATALGARILAQRVNYPYREEAYIAGLLHDIGKLIFDRYLKDRYDEVVEFATTNNVPFVEAEAQIIGYDHAQIGALVISSWDLPARFVEAVATHHTPAVAKDFPELAYIVHLANAFTLSLGLDVGGDGLMMMIDAEAVTKLGLDAVQIDKLISEIAEAVVAAGVGVEPSAVGGVYGEEVAASL